MGGSSNFHCALHIFLPCFHLQYHLNTTRPHHMLLPELLYLPPPFFPPPTSSYFGKCPNTNIFCPVMPSLGNNFPPLALFQRVTQSRRSSYGCKFQTCIGTEDARTAGKDTMTGRVLALASEESEMGLGRQLATS